jgi:glycosyltransferase involved in cell wall biosynthesis
VNDGSPDDTARISKEWATKDPRVVYIERMNTGLSAARNTGLAAAAAEWVLFLDADDLIAPEFLSRHLDVIARGGVDVSCCGGIDTTLSGEPLLERDAPEFVPDALTRLLSGNVAVVHSFVLRRSAIQEVGGFDEKLSSFEDWDLWLRLAAAGCRFMRVDYSGAIYRRYPNSMSCDIGRMYLNGMRVMSKARLLCRCAEHYKLVKERKRWYREWYIRKEAWPILKRALTGQEWTKLLRVGEYFIGDPGLLTKVPSLIIRQVRRNPL